MQSTRKGLGTGLRGDVMKFRAKSSEREGNVWVLVLGVRVWSGLICVCGVFDVYRGKCFGTCDVMNALYFLVKERQVISTFELVFITF